MKALKSILKGSPDIALEVTWIEWHEHVGFYLRVMFTVDDIDDTLARLRKHGAELVSSEVVQDQDAYRLCYIRGPEGLLIGLAQELG